MLNGSLLGFFNCRGQLGIVLILVAERLFMISHTDDEGNMPMGMKNTSDKNKKT